MGRTSASPARTAANSASAISGSSPDSPHRRWLRRGEGEMLVGGHGASGSEVRAGVCVVKGGWGMIETTCLAEPQNQEDACMIALSL